MVGDGVEGDGSVSNECPMERMVIYMTRGGGQSEMSLGWYNELSHKNINSLHEA